MSINLPTLPKGIIFDCDGVIIDSFDSNTYFYNLLRSGVGLPPMTEEQREEVHQLTGAQAMELVIPPALQDAAISIYKRIDYVRDIVPMLTVNKGLHSLLEFCKQHHILTGVHTNRIIGMKEILDRNELSSYFHPVITPDEFPAKPSPIGALDICKTWNISPQEALFVGDSENDRKTALAAKIPFIAFKNPRLEALYHADDFHIVEAQLKFLV